jgi:AcrR family transcriptional regulator
VRAAVLAAALAELLAHGIYGLSISQVALRAGVHETTIYRRWATKPALAIAAILNGTEASIPDPNTGNLHDDLVALLGSIAKFIRTPLGDLLLQLAARRDQPENQQARHFLTADRFAAGTAILDRAQQRGELRDRIDHRQHKGALLAGQRARDPLDPDEAGRAVRADGLQNSTTPSPSMSPLKRSSTWILVNTGPSAGSS